MEIGIIGSGNIGGTLGQRLAQVGHQVVFGVRDLNNFKARTLLADTTPLISVANIAEAVRSTTIVVLATPWSAARDAIEAAGSWEGKILIDCTNPIKATFDGLETDPTTSAAEQIAGWAKGAVVVKAFNTTGFNNLENPNYGDAVLSMFIAGDDTPANETVASLARDLGFDPIITGDLTTARYLESLAMLWVQMAFKAGMGRDFGFRVVFRHGDYR